jgi:hypothetical protein
MQSLPMRYKTAEYPGQSGESMNNDNGNGQTEIMDME